ncbi:E3 ubiquitin-protein ligase ATL31 [Fusarium oxysporum f. sp. cubense]|uniref:E3 ubiquitin-protein ligase ATL31 n=1 Tax=Fusarium oxysporum f. sp. cubense TaxID=61366 RepID=A0A559L4K0_FUSOC|nr:E3 ubiquitin-protein ligase ATL31 [Fusarium oxysporum f. sp. cubense]
MAVTSRNIPASAQGPNKPNSSHSELAWLPIIILPLLALMALVFLGAPRLCSWARYDFSLIDESTSSSSSASARHSGTQTRDLPHLNAVAPPKTSQALRSELSHEVHAAWAVPNRDMTCVICLNVVKDTDLIRHLPCEHTFHANCIAAWYFAGHDTCPICADHFSSPKPLPQRPLSVHL